VPSSREPRASCPEMPECRQRAVDVPLARVENGDPPSVSVIMPVYNAGRYLGPAIQSILSQTYRSLELIIVDDGSTDHCLDSVPAMADPRVHVIRQVNRGKAAAMNTALAVAKGAFYALQDADDISAPHRLEIQVRSLLANAHVAGVFCGHALLLGASDRPVAPRMRLKDESECARAVSRGLMPAHDPTGMYRRSLVGDIRYAEDLRVAEGLDYILRVGERFPLMVVEECLYYYRIHPASLTRRSDAERLASRQLMARRLVTRRPELGVGYIPDAAQDAREAVNELPNHFAASVSDQVMSGRRLGALRTALLAVRLAPGNRAHWRPLLRAVAPRPLVAAWRWHGRRGTSVDTA